MATVDDYIAKRAESYSFLTQTMEGLGLIDAIGGTQPANILAAGLGSALGGSGIAGKTFEITLKFKNAAVSGAFNVVEDEGNPGQYRAFVTGAASHYVAEGIVSATAGGALLSAIGGVIASPGLVSAGALAGTDMTDFIDPSGWQGGNHRTFLWESEDSLRIAI